MNNLVAGARMAPSVPDTAVLANAAVPRSASGTAAIPRLIAAGLRRMCRAAGHRDRPRAIPGAAPSGGSRSARKRLVIAVAALTACATGPAFAAEVNIHLSGTINAVSGDASTLFGLSGSAAGAPIDVTISYDPDTFGTPYLSASNYVLWTTYDGSLPRGGLQITETVNGHSFTYDTNYYGGFLLSNAPGGPFQYSNWTQSWQAVSESNSPYGSGVNATELLLGTLDNSTSILGSLNPSGSFNFAGVGIQSNGSNWNTAAGNVSWGFDIAAVPEPVSASLLGAGLLGLIAARRARAADRM